MARFLACFAVAALATTAAADDEASEHTAQLMGADADTVGVSVAFAESDGWSMTVRPTPGANPITTKLALPKTHGHYLAYVAPGRRAIAFVEVSAGRAPGAKDIAGWVYAPDGKLLRSWTFAAIVDGKELADTHASVSHWSVFGDGTKLTAAGLELVTRKGKKVVLAADATTFH